MTSTLSSARARPSFSWLRVRTVVRRHAYVLWRSPHRWFDIVVWPLFDILLWGSLGAFVAQENDASQAGTPYLLAGIMLFHVLFQSQIAVSTGFMEETWSRNLLNMMTTPLREIEYVVGLAVYGIGKLVAAMAMVCLTAAAFYGFNLGTVGWGLVPIVGILLVVGWALSMLVIGLLLRYGQSAEILAWASTFLILSLSGVFNPVEAIPGPLQPFSRILPTTHVFGAARDLLAGEPAPWSDLGVAALGALVLAALSMVFVTRKLAQFRHRGYVTRYS
ncbi:MAG TPA: ABC transporter permease [Acidimicrobiales bacterium]|nr:ABC transporter permease [Acidimicrobiales bacterium]